MLFRSYSGVFTASPTFVGAVPVNFPVAVIASALVIVRLPRLVSTVFRSLCVVGSLITRGLTTSSVVPTSTAACTQSYTVVSGDTCYDIAVAHGLTLAAFQALKTANLGADHFLICRKRVICRKG